MPKLADEETIQIASDDKKAETDLIPLCDVLAKDQQDLLQALLPKGPSSDSIQPIKVTK